MKLQHFVPGLLAPAGVLAWCAPTAIDTKNEVIYTGFHHNGIELFHGISFGQDTGGEARFKPPRLFVPERGSKINATEYGPACPQPLGPAFPPLVLTDTTDVSEDCLNLAIGRPKGTKPGDKLPVLIWIHGGSLYIGKNSEESTVPDGLVANSAENGTPIIHVNINYRLGVFGFAQSDALTSEKSANAGLRDQRLAIEWVRDNIAFFGGDPSRITISGQSSGGLGVTMQMLAYGGAKGISFQRVIIQSQATAPLMGSRNLTDEAMQRVSDYMGCNKTSVDDPQTIACFRAAPMFTLLNASVETWAGDTAHNLGDIWLPRKDGDFIPDGTAALITSGRFTPVPAMIGWSEHDLAYYTDRSISTPEETRTFMSTYLRDFPVTLVTQLLDLYPVSEFPEKPGLSSEFLRSERMLRDIFMVCQPNWLAHYIHAAGKEVYLYNWNQSILPPILENMDGTPRDIGPIHSSENAYVFGNIDMWNRNGWPFNPTEADYSLVRRGTRSWASFVTRGGASIVGKETFQGWEEAFAGGGDWKIFVAGGPAEGLATPGIKGQNLTEKCGFINSPEFLKALKF